MNTYNSVFAAVHFINLRPGKVFSKRQYRCNNGTKQLVMKDKGWINMEPRTKIYGWVKREKSEAKLENETRKLEVLIKMKILEKY